MDGWTIAFLVSYDERKLKEPPGNNKDLKSRWETLEPGKYSLNQIVLFLGSAPLASIDESKCSYPGMPQGDIGLTYFRIFLEWNLKDLQKNPGALTIGYTIKKEVPGGEDKAPTYPPTKVKYQNYRYEMCSDTAKEINDKPVPPDARNAFLFVEMTGENVEFPKEKFEKKGNLIIQQMPGSLAFSKSLFVNKYLLGNAFVDYNMSMLDTLNAMLGWIQKSYRKPGPWTLTDKSRDEVVPETKWTSSDKGGTLSWTGRQYLEVKGPLKYWGNETNSTFTSNLECVPRGNEIKLNGTMHVEWKSWDLPTFGNNTYHYTEAEIELELVFTLTSVDNGVLNVTVKQDLKKCRCRDGDDKSVPGWLNWLLGPSNTDLANEMKNNITEKVKTTKIGDTLADKINKQQYFVFPGSGTFLYKNLTFSDACDVLIELNYIQKDLEKG